MWGYVVILKLKIAVIYLKIMKCNKFRPNPKLPKDFIYNLIRIC